MSRSKTSKSKPKKSTKSLNRAVSSVSLEKDFKNLPSKLIAQIRKEIAAFKKEEASQQAQLKKAQQLKKTLNDKQDRLLEKANHTLNAAAKKRLNSFKKDHANTHKMIANLTKQLDATQKSIRHLANKNAIITALSKHMATLEKEITAKLEKPPQKATIKKTKSTPAIKKQSVSENTVTADGPMAEPVVESIES